MGSDSEEARLIELCVSGDEGAFEVLFERYRDPVYGYVLRMLRNAEVSEEVVIEVFERVFAALPSFRIGSPFRPWLYAVARNECLMRIRHAKTESLAERSVAGPPPAPGPYQEAARGELRSILRQEIDRLEEQYREVVILAYFQGLNSREIAQTLGTNENTVRTRLARALGRLRDRLGRAVL